jgi:hypothetical protein
MYHQFYAQQEADADVHVGSSTCRQELGQCFANEIAISNENKRSQSRAESSGLSGFPGDRGSLITVWLADHQHFYARQRAMLIACSKHQLASERIVDTGAYRWWRSGGDMRFAA